MSGDFTEIHILEDGLMKEYKLGFYEKKEQPNKSQGEQEGWLSGVMSQISDSGSLWRLVEHVWCAREENRAC